MKFDSIEKELVLLLYNELVGTIQKTVFSLDTEEEATRLAHSLNTMLETLNKSGAENASFYRGYDKGLEDGVIKGYQKGYQEGSENMKEQIGKLVQYHLSNIDLPDEIE